MGLYLEGMVLPNGWVIDANDGYTCEQESTE